MRLIARRPTKRDLESTFFEPRIGYLRHNNFNLTLTKRFYACTQYSYNTSTTTDLNSACQQLHEITQLTTFALLIKLSKTNHAQCLHSWYGRNIMKLLLLSPHKSSHANFPYSVDSFKIPDVDEPFWKGHIEAGLKNNLKTFFFSGLVRNQHQFCSRRTDSTATIYFLRPESRHRPH